jgi:capsular polysaccharide biosynthesis protein
MGKTLSLAAGILLLIGAGTIPILVTIVTFILPPTFSSTARIRPAVSEATAVGTEVEVLRSNGVLLPVMANLNLTQKWGEKFREPELRTDVVNALLRRDLEIKRTKDTLLIEISVLSDNPQEAADIANEIAGVYVKSPLAARGSGTGPGPQVIEAATPELRPVKPDILMNIASGFGVGAIMGVVGVWLIVRRNPPRERASVTS